MAQTQKRRGNDEVIALTGELAKIAEASIKDAQLIATNARRSLQRAGQGASSKARALVAELERTVGVLEQIVVQTRTRIEGEVPDGSTRVVSLHDTDARPIRKGRLGRPVEFGYKAQVLDNTDGIILDHKVVVGNPPDAPMLAPAISRLKALTGRLPRAVTADRGYGEAKVETELGTFGVKTVAIPRKGRAGAERHRLKSSRRFRKLVKWRTGSEGRISHLKHAWGWDRTLLDGIGGARAWCGWGVFAHNATKIAVLIDEKETKAKSHDQSSPPRANATGPPIPPTRRAA